MLEACCHIVRIDLVDLETILLTFVRFPESVRPAPPKAEEALRSFELSVLLRLAMVMNFGGMVVHDEQMKMERVHWTCSTYEEVLEGTMVYAYSWSARKAREFCSRGDAIGEATTRWLFVSASPLPQTDGVS